MSAFLSFDPIFTVPQALLILILAVGASAWLYRRTIAGEQRNRRQIAALAVLRVLGVLAISILLLNPVFTRTQRESEKPPLLVLLDASHSMAIRDVDERARFDAARIATIEDTDLMRHLQERYQVRLFRVAETATPQDADSFL